MTTVSTASVVITSAAQIVRLVGGNEDVMHLRMPKLWEWQLISRWAFLAFGLTARFIITSIAPLP